MPFANYFLYAFFVGEGLTIVALGVSAFCTWMLSYYRRVKKIPVALTWLRIRLIVDYLFFFFGTASFISILTYGLILLINKMKG